MQSIHHHIPDSLLAAYVSGALPRPFGVVVAAHVSLCETCRAAMLAHEAAGGAILDSFEPIEVSSDLRERVLASLDDEVAPEPAPVQADGPLPAPVVEALGGRKPKWRSLGPGASQCILEHGAAGSVRLLKISPGYEVPDHSHNGLELTLVLQGAFRDVTGRYGRGDLEVADSDLEHTPIAEQGEACICLAASDAPLKFSSLIPRIFQPIFRI
ncbi:ChrR family anti-sigma-E factor [Celeribacter arenosi]|uniref:ChrR family anti-sigma-E factor n=1 Tax=Celeribacter arenosi TaxID=792649 RepID=A0ABP7JRY0_9RHOB